jgi:hypothetical protein
MNLARYPFEYFTEKYYYEFYSTGPNGKVRKLACFTLVEDTTFPVYNIGFGDAEENSFEINDRDVTNNNDSMKVLLTIALIALAFLRYRPGVWIFAAGTSPARNRLYRMLITKYWKEINQFFAINGEIDGRHYPFEPGINYDGLIFIFRK